MPQPPKEVMLKSVANHAEQVDKREQALATAMCLAQDEGASLREIGDAAGLSHQTVKTTISRHREANAQPRVDPVGRAWTQFADHVNWHSMHPYDNKRFADLIAVAHQHNETDLDFRQLILSHQYGTPGIADEIAGQLESLFLMGFAAIDASRQ